MFTGIYDLITMAGAMRNQNQGESLNAETIQILAVCVALAGVILTAARWMRQDINDLRCASEKLRGRMTYLEGLLEGFREAITGRAAAVDKSSGSPNTCQAETTQSPKNMARANYSIQPDWPCE